MLMQGLRSVEVMALNRDDVLLSQHALEIFGRSLPHNDNRQSLDRLANRLTKILAEIRKLKTT